MRYYVKRYDSMHYHFSNKSHIIDNNYCDNSMLKDSFISNMEMLKDSFISKENFKNKLK